MGYSDVIYSSIGMTDVVVPGAPTLTIIQINNSEIEARVTMPNEDADGNPLSGLNELIIVVMKELEGGGNPFKNIPPENLISHAEENNGFSQSIFLTESDAGSLKVGRFSDLSINNVYWVAAVVRDDS
ncbi:MAG: hypothetical protein ACOCV1_00770 [Bacillota bacterium]